MPAAFTISAVNTGTNELTVTGHGLTTGDRTRARNVGGALPAPLAGVTDYFAIRIDANTLKLATSSSNALSNNPIDITTVGSGTNTLEYGLPYCIPRISVPGSQVFSADNNATWQSLVALHDLLTGQPQSVWSSVNLAVPFMHNHWRWFGFPRAGREFNLVFDNGSSIWNGCLRATGAAADYAGGQVQGLPEGWRVTGLKMGVIGTGGAQSVNLRLKYQTANAAGETQIGICTAVNPAAGSEVIVTSDPIATPTTLAAGVASFLFVNADLPLSGTIITRFAIKVERP